MPNYLEKFNSHLLLEPKENDKNSFIANVNTLAKYQNYLENLNLFLTEETYKDFLDLIANNGLTGVNIEAVGEDLRRGTFRGKRQLAIDLVANMSMIATLPSFVNSSLPQDLSVYSTSQLMNLVNTLSHSELHKLYNTKTSRVYYDSITVHTTENSDGLTFTYSSDKELFNNDLIYNAQTLYNVLQNIIKAYPYSENASFFINDQTGLVMENTISNDGDDESRHYVIIYDNVSSATDGQSNITSITLKEASQSVYNSVVGASSGAYSNRAIRSQIEYKWDDTTSSLRVISTSLNEVLEAADVISSSFESMLSTIEKATGISDKIIALGERLRDIRVSTTPTPFTDAPTVSTVFTQDDAEDQYTTLNFGLPSAGVALFDTTQMSIDSDGKLVMNAFAFDTTKASQVVSSNVNDDGTVTITIRPAGV